MNVSFDDSAKKLTELKAKVGEGEKSGRICNLHKCTECGWVGRQEKALTEHIRKHTGTSRQNSLSNNTETGKDEKSEMTTLRQKKKLN